MRKIGTYQIVRPLVSNRSIHSFEALDLRLGRRVALLFPNLHQAGNAQVTPFLHGAPTVTALRHPNIARVYELGMENGLPCIITEPVQGIEIDALVRAEPSPGAEWKVHVVNQICEALAHAHSRHVIHLDIRPANVFATPAGDVKVMGFGAAPLRAAGVEKAAIGIDDVLYMAPEQIVAASVDHRADIFSTGALAYELFSGCQPFAGGSPQEVLDKIQNQRPDPALLPETEYSPRLEAILMKALAQKPGDRYQRIEEMQKAMDDLLRNSVDAFFERMLQAESPTEPTSLRPRRQLRKHGRP